MKDGFVLILGGGGMAGVFGAGVVTRLQDEGLSHHFAAVHGNSAGAMNGAFFLAGQARLGSSIYYEDLTRHFLSAKRMLSRRFDGLTKRADARASPSVLNLDYLFEEVLERKALDVERLNGQPVPLYASLLDFASHRVVDVDVRGQDTIKKLRAAVSYYPYCGTTEWLNGSQYADAMIKDPIGLERLQQLYPGKRLILQLNQHPGRSRLHAWLDKLESRAVVSGNDPLRATMEERERRRQRDLKRARHSRWVMLLHPPRRCRLRHFTTDAATLAKAHALGWTAAGALCAALRGSQRERAPRKPVAPARPAGARAGAARGN